jgi:hypothetical protein
LGLLRSLGVHQYACAHVIVGSSYKGFLIFETKLSTFMCYFMCYFNNHVLIFFPCTNCFSSSSSNMWCDHRKKTMTKDNIHKKLLESMVIYPNGHNLWFGNSIYYYFDMIFTKIVITNKFPKPTCLDIAPTYLLSTYLPNYLFTI